MSWNQQPSNQQPSAMTADFRDARVSAFLGRVYAWMFLGLLVTTSTAFVVASTPVLIDTIIHDRVLLWVLLFGQLGLVWYLSARVQEMSPTMAGVLFMVYSASVGVTTSIFLLVYTGASLVSTFMVTAGMFGALALFGTFTKRSLAGVGQFMFMGLIGLVIALIVNILFMSDALDFVISVLGLIVFTWLT